MSDGTEEKAGPNDQCVGRIARISVMEGICSQVFNSVCSPGSAFLTKFAIMLGATPFQFSILMATGQISQIFQLLGSLATGRRQSRKSVVLALQGGARSLALLLGLLPFIPAGGAPVTLFLVLLFLSVSLSAAADNAWLGWIADLVPQGFRGRFLSRRAQFQLFTAIGAGYGLSLLLERFTGSSAQTLSAMNVRQLGSERLPLGFLMLFGLAALAGALGILLLSRQPETAAAEKAKGTGAAYLLPLRDRNFRAFLLYSCCWAAAIGIGAPFWQPFMMQRLGMSLVEVQIYGSINIVASALVMRVWGSLIDFYGNRAAMRFIILLGGLNPMVWLFVTPGNYPILFLEAITSGIMWGGAGLVATNFSLSLAPQDKRQIYAGITAAASGLSMMTTMLASGALVQWLPQIPELRLEPEQLLFGLGGIARWCSQWPLSRVQEPNSKSAREALSAVVRAIRERVG